MGGGLVEELGAEGGAELGDDEADEGGRAEAAVGAEEDAVGSGAGECGAYGYGRRGGGLKPDVGG